MSLEDWKRRYTVRKFDRNIIPQSQHIDYIKEVLKYTPTQQGQVDHMWCVLGPKDQKLKDYLVENYYYCDDINRRGESNRREYFSVLADAPYLFTSFAVNLYLPKYLRFELSRREKKILSKNPPDEEVSRNNAFHAGILVTESLKLGYDTAQIACHEGWHTSKKPEYREMMWETFGDNLSKKSIELTNGTIAFKKDYIGKCLMSVGIGKGLPLTDHEWEKYKTGVTFTGQKYKKWFGNIV
tara:strand:+ start:1514 stop:2233 length:720 start_codon:yes stop_codon:yes gene_type:complete